MLRRRKDVDWARVLPPGDLTYLRQRIQPDSWYPMETFENFGVAILTHVEGATLNAVRMWGHFSASQLATDHPGLIAVGEPAETLMRLKVLRGTLFDFPAFDVPMLSEGQAFVTIHFGMRAVAEEAACFQTLGFCEGVLALAGAVEACGVFRERSWAGDPSTRLLLEWQNEEP